MSSDAFELLCTFKGYRSAGGDKVSFFNFPKNPNLRKSWIHAIRRDPGKDFQLNNVTKVCSRHFKPTDMKKSLNGVVTLKPGSIPSKFAWSFRSPKKRKLPAKRQARSKASTDLVESEASTSEFVDEFLEPTVEELLTESKRNNEKLKEEISNLQIKLNELQIAKHRQEEANKQLVAVLESERREALEALFEREAKNDEMEKKCHLLEEKLQDAEAKLFKLDNLKSDENIAFYTGFPNYSTFQAIFKFLNTGEKGENVRYYSTKKTVVTADFYQNQEDEGEEEDEVSQNTGRRKCGRPRKLTVIDEFFIVMCRLRRGFAELHLANLFGVSQSTISRLFTTYINYMYLKTGQVNIWPSRALVDKTMPDIFKEKYPNTRVIIDCTEIRCQMPSGLLLNSELFSSYKNHVTFKGLVGIAPNGATTFISQLYTGSISDREIVTRSGFLDLKFEDGDAVMADKGFTIEDLLPLGVSLNIPPFLGENAQMSKEDVITTQQIASVRIHIERAINLIKNYHIWDGEVPLSLIGLLNQMWSVCAFLTNARDPLISV